jgi:hypothetical protein
VLARPHAWKVRVRPRFGGCFLGRRRRFRFLLPARAPRRGGAGGLGSGHAGRAIGAQRLLAGGCRRDGARRRGSGAGCPGSGRERRSGRCCARRAWSGCHARSRLAGATRHGRRARVAPHGGQAVEMIALRVRNARVSQRRQDHEQADSPATSHRCNSPVSNFPVMHRRDRTRNRADSPSVPPIRCAHPLLYSHPVVLG